MDHAHYERRLSALQRELSLLQTSYVKRGYRGVVVLEGWDAAGKGGLVRRMGWCVDPRYFRVWSIGAPKDHERREHWIKRFWDKVPQDGHIAVFDRSWYGRVLVERIEGYAEEGDWRRAYSEITAFEQTLTDEGYRLVKLFLDISPETQLKRFQERFANPEKRWKITEEDLRNRARWHLYEEAYAEMLEKTSGPSAPWLRLDGNHKRKLRLQAFQAIIEGLGNGVEVHEPQVSPLLEAFFHEPR